ncbi:MAG: DUF1223 domain-containing protein [Candidatus Kapaibacterium sp.]
MRFLIVLCALVIVAAGAMIFFGGTAPHNSEKLGQMQEIPDTATSGFALVELFTSEGCSSCPPAEKFLNRLVAEAEEKGIALFPVAFHVDYWDRLGWKDRFSSSTWSDRQRAYAEVFRLESIYTPQMIVNGSVEFTGSNESRGRNEIAKALTIPGSLKIGISAGIDSASVIRYACTLDTIPSNADLVLLLVENNLTSDVSRGENKGKKLNHANVVRLLERIPLGKANRVEGRLVIPDEVNQEELALIAFVQDQKTMKIFGAVRSEL